MLFQITNLSALYSIFWMQNRISGGFFPSVSSLFSWQNHPKSSGQLWPSGMAETKRKCQLSPKEGRFYCPSNQAIRVGCSTKLGTKNLYQCILFSLIVLDGDKFMEDWFLWEREIKMWRKRSHRSSVLACEGTILRALLIQIDTGLLLS